MNTPTDLELARDARRRILWAASQEANTLKSVDLFDPVFDHAARGFHLIEHLADATSVRWMEREASFRVRNQSTVLTLEARSPVEDQFLEIWAKDQLISRLPISTDWTRAEIDLGPPSEKSILIRLRGDFVSPAPGDSRELALLFRTLRLGDPSPPPAEPSVRAPSAPSVSWHQSDLPRPARIPSSTPLPAKRHVIQAVKFFRPHDAISHEILAMQDQLRAMGFESSILAEQVAMAFRHHVTEGPALAEILAAPDTILILHHGTPWRYGETLLAHTRASIRVLRYHNVTSSEGFLRYPAGYLDATIDGRFATTGLAAHATELWAVCHWAMGDLMACGVPPPKLHYVPFLHDLDTLDTSSPPPFDGDADARLRLLVLGRQVPSKGLHHALAILARLRSDHGDRVRLDIVGSRDPLLAAYHAELDQFIARHNLAGAVFFHQEGGRSTVVDHLQHCDALLTMSESDAACIPILEAAWFSKPIVGLNRGGKAAAAGPGQFLFDGLDPYRHAQAWIALVDDPGLRQTLGRLARQHVERAFSPEGVRLAFSRQLNRALRSAAPVQSAESDPGE